MNYSNINVTSVIKNFEINIDFPNNMPLYQQIHNSRTFDAHLVVQIYALFPPIILDWNAESANFFRFQNVWFKCNFILMVSVKLIFQEKTLFGWVLSPQRPWQECSNVNSVIMKQHKNICWEHTSMLVLDLNVISVAK